MASQRPSHPWRRPRSRPCRSTASAEGALYRILGRSELPARYRYTTQWAALGAGDVETATHRLKTVHRGICASKVIQVIIIQRRLHSERAGPGLGRGPDHCDQYITRVPREPRTRCPGERPACVVPGISEGLLPAPRKLRIDMGKAQQEHPSACLAILYRARPCARQVIGRITVGTAQEDHCQGHCAPPWSPLHGIPFSRPRVHLVPRAYPKTSAHTLAACGLPL